MKRYTKWLCGLLAVVLLIGAVCPASADNSVSATESTGGIYTEEVDYFPYYDTYASTPFTTQSIKLAAADAELVDGAIPHPAGGGRNVPFQPVPQKQMAGAGSGDRHFGDLAADRRVFERRKC